MNTRHYNLFPVPLTYHEGFLPHNLTLKVKEYLLDIKSKVTGIHGAIVGDGVSMHDSTKPMNIIEDISRKVIGCSNLQDNLKRCIDQYAAILNIRNPKLNNSWFNIQNKGSILDRHRHSNFLFCTQFSGALYINIEVNESPIEFENPNPFALTLDNENSKTVLTNYFRPQAGDLIFFPSWLIHSVAEPIKNDNRIVISFNVESK